MWLNRENPMFSLGLKIKNNLGQPYFVNSSNRDPSAMTHKQKIENPECERCLGISHQLLVPLLTETDAPIYHNDHMITMQYENVILRTYEGHLIKTALCGRECNTCSSQ